MQQMKLNVARGSDLRHGVMRLGALRIARLKNITHIMIDRLVGL